jgi:hypothetical protein
MNIDKSIMNEIVKFCFNNKIVFEMSLDKDSNYTFIDKKDNKFILSISNDRDKNLNKIISEGFDNLKEFVNQLPAK